MLEKEWDEEDESKAIPHSENQTVAELAHEALKSEERIQRIIMRENNQ